MPATVTDLRTRRPFVAPNREEAAEDDFVLHVARVRQAAGLPIYDERMQELMGEAPTREDGARSDPTATTSNAAPFTSPAPFVSPFLLRPIRTEAEVRAQLNRPRRKTLLDLIGEQTGIAEAFRKLIGRDAL